MSDSRFLSLEKLTLSYGKNVAVPEMDLDIGKGELVALLGPSGCGKTTTMRAIAGLLSPSSGTIRLDGTDITRTPANKRPVGLVFQSYALFPHLNVYENVAFGLRLMGIKGKDLEDRVNQGLKTVGLGKFTTRKPAELSGGQQQRVSLARSMVMEPKVLLLDEPLSNLDARLRLEMRTELQRVQKESGVTMIFVTHDQVEALAMADRIIVMKDGLIEQIGTPEDIYNHPVSDFVADFVGFENVFALENGMLKTGSQYIDLHGNVPPGTKGLAWRPGTITLGTGPHQGLVRGTSFAGGTREYLLDTPLGQIKAECDATLPIHSFGSTVAFDLQVEKAAPLARFGGM
jgi:putative spermidine/putrescine transport system ATP-binding protein